MQFYKSRIAMIVSLSLLVLGTAEGLARLFIPANAPFLAYARQTPNDFVRSGWTPNWRGEVNIDGVGGQRGNYPLRINSFGFRGQSMKTAEKARNTVRIFFMGGSFVEEMALSEEKTFPALLEKELQQSFPEKTIECVNAGISGFMSEDLLLQFKYQILNYQPDLLVVTVPAINDIRYGTLPEYDPDHPLPPGAQKQASTLLTRSRLLHGLYRLAGRYQQANAPYSRSLEKFQAAVKKSNYTTPSQSKAYDVFIHQLQEIIRIAKKESVQVILMSEPSVYQTPLPKKIEGMLWMGLMREDINLNPLFLEKEMIRFNQGARLTAAQESAGFLDLAAAIPKDMIHFYDDVHLTPTGSQKVAGVLTDWLVDNLTAIKTTGTIP